MSEEFADLKYRISEAIQEFLFKTVDRRAAGPVTVVQVGANDGNMNDPVNLWVKSRHWRGVFVEPVDHFFKLLQKSYEGHDGLQFFQVACGSTASVAPFFQIRNPDEVPFPWMLGLSSFNQDVIRRHFASDQEFELYVEKVEVKITRLDDLLDIAEIAVLDILVIDTEGSELSVLDGIDLKKRAPSIVMVEHHHLSWTEKEELQQRLYELGYTRITGLFDTYFVKFGFLERVELDLLSLVSQGHLSK